MIKIMTREELSEMKHEILDSLLRIANDQNPGEPFFIRCLVPEYIWRDWKKKNIGVVLWLGKRFYEHPERKAIFKCIYPAEKYGAALYVNAW